MANYEEYLIESRKICKKIMTVIEFNLDAAVKTVQDHFIDVKEPQYKSLFLMRLFQVCIEMIKPKESIDITFKLFNLGNITKQ